MYNQQSCHIRRQRQQNPVLSVFLRNNPKRIYSITVPPSKQWSVFLQKIKKQFHLSSDAELAIYPYSNYGSKSIDISHLQSLNTENSDMNKIPHKMKLCVDIINDDQNIHLNEEITNNNTNDTNSDSSPLTTNADINHKTANLHLMNESYVQPQFGLDMDIFGRFSPKKRSKSKKMNINIYHFYDYQKMDFHPKYIWKQLSTKVMLVTHIDQKYTLMRFKSLSLNEQKSEIFEKQIQENQNYEQNQKIDLSLFTIRTRRLIWPLELQVKNEFECNLKDIEEGWIWAIFICHGGKFAGAIYKGKTMILHKTIRRYVIRGKQGKRQINHLSSSGVKAGSAGGYKRSYNEQQLLIEIREVLKKWQPYLQTECHKIFIHLPGKYNSKTFFGTNEEQNILYPKNMHMNDQRFKDVLNKNKNNTMFRLCKKDERIVKIPITTHSVTLHEIERVHFWLATIWMQKNSLKV